MTQAERHDGWMSLSGSRRMPSRVATVVHATDDAKTGEPQPAERPAPAPLDGAPNSVGSAPPLAQGRRIRIARRRSGRRIGDRPQLRAMHTMGPINWIETLRGVLFLAIVGGVLWIEWIAIKAIATYVSSLF